MKPVHDSDLMAFADGELDERAMRELEDRLAHDSGIRDKVDAVTELGEVVRGHLELAADAVPARRFDAIWREVDKAIESASASQTAPVRETAKSGGEQIGLVGRIGRWFDRYRGHVLTGAVTAGAVAMLALVLRPASPSREETVADRPIERPSQPQQPPQQLVTHQPAEIESLDTPGGTGTVFNLQDEDGNTTVIWVTPEDTVEGI
jgi:anti-sigma factor RsiW